MKIIKKDVFILDYKPILIQQNGLNNPGIKIIEKLSPDKLQKYHEKLKKIREDEYQNLIKQYDIQKNNQSFKNESDQLNSKVQGESKVLGDNCIESGKIEINLKQNLPTISEEQNLNSQREQASKQEQSIDSIKQEEPQNEPINQQQKNQSNVSKYSIAFQCEKCYQTYVNGFETQCNHKYHIKCFIELIEENIQQIKKSGTMKCGGCQAQINIDTMCQKLKQDNKIDLLQQLQKVIN